MHASHYALQGLFRLVLTAFYALRPTLFTMRSASPV